MERVFEEDVYTVDIEWSDPSPYDNTLQSSLEDLHAVYLYKTIGQYHRHFHLLYIGKTFTQYVTQRLSNKDHQSKRNELQSQYPRHALLVSFGSVTSSSKRNARLIDEVESLLIYTHSNSPKLQNKNKVWTKRIIRDYKITNSGFREEGMVKEINLGLFYKG